MAKPYTPAITLNPVAEDIHTHPQDFWGLEFEVHRLCLGMTHSLT